MKIFRFDFEIKIPEISDIEKQFIIDNHKNLSAPELAKKLKKANTTIYKWLDKLGLKAKNRQITKDHPFKVQNRRLEAMLITAKQQSEKNKI